MHLTEADLGAVLDPAEGGGGRREAARLHAASCATCREALASTQAADRDAGHLLRLLDHPVPALDFASVRDRGMRDGSGTMGRGTTERSSPETVRLIARQRVGASRAPTLLRRSAVILALGAAAAAAAVPRSPVRRLAARFLSRPRVEAASPAAPAQVAPTPPTSLPAAPRGVAIVPSGRVDIVFRAEQPVGELDIRSASGARVAITATGEGPNYTVGRDIITVDNRAAPGLNYEVEIPPPAQLPAVTIRVGDHVVFAREGATITTTSPRRPDGSYRIPLSGSGVASPYPLPSALPVRRGVQ
jgi:hypothetical protein